LLAVKAEKEPVQSMKEDWVLSVEEQAVSNGSAFFFKQWALGAPMA
jgi:protein gp37